MEESDWERNIRLYLFGDPWPVTVEDMYQAFKERMLKEMSEDNAE